jgi:FkbM family methyltransferase
MADIDDFRRRANFHRSMSRFPATRRAAKLAFAKLCRDAGSENLSARRTIAGIPVDLDLSRAADRTIYLQGACDLRGVRAIDQVMARLDVRTAWDVGANRGNHSAFMRRRSRRLFSFEPNPEEYNRLYNLFESDRCATQLNIGLSDHVGELPFLVCEGDSGNSTFEIPRNGANTSVRVRTGDDVAAEYNISDIDFIKLDVEKHEFRVLRGMRNIFSNQRPTMIFEILQDDNVESIDFCSDLPRYRLFGNKIGFVSSISMTAYQFCEFEYGRTYMCALAVPEEKVKRLRDLLPQ